MTIVNILASLTLSLFLLTGAATAEEKAPIRWGTDSWPNFTHTDGTGFYHDLINAVFKNRGFNLEVKYMNWPRVVNALDDGRIDMSGAVQKAGKYHYSRHPILEQEILILAPPEVVNNSSINKLQRLTGAWRKGYRNAIVEQSSLGNLYGVELDNPQLALKLMSKGRIDYYIDISSIINKLDSNALQAMRTKTVGHYKLYWAFTQNDKGLVLKRHFDQAVAELKQSGELQRLYWQYELNLPW